MYNLSSVMYYFKIITKIVNFSPFSKYYMNSDKKTLIKGIIVIVISNYSVKMNHALCEILEIIWEPSKFSLGL